MENTQKKVEQTIEESSILEFLESNPNFFLRHSSILEKLTLPTTVDGNIASFNDFQNRKLMQKITHLEERNKRLIRTAMQNIQSTQQINTLTLNLLHSTNKEDMFSTFRQVVKNELALDSVVFHKQDDTELYSQLQNSFNSEQTVCLRTANDETPCLHEQNGVCIRSEALIHLTNSRNENLGILVLGSADIQRFYEGQGTELLAFLGGIISYKLESFVTTA